VSIRSWYLVFLSIPTNVHTVSRKAAMTAHPDKGGSEEKMAAVNEAYEVLSNSELRARFDNGDDPNDPTSGQQGGPGGGYGFQQGFGGHGFPSGGGFGGGHPFQDFFSGGGGGGQFHFRTG
jgi:DnaJ family protein C protein 3